MYEELEAHFVYLYSSFAPALFTCVSIKEVIGVFVNLRHNGHIWITMTLNSLNYMTVPGLVEGYLYPAPRNLLIASIVAFAFDKTVCASGMNRELMYAGVSDVEAIALVTGTYPSPP
jgi:hypothetical protein